MTSWSLKWSDLAIILIVRPNRHVIETVVTHAPMFHGAPSWVSISLHLARINIVLLHTLVDHTLISQLLGMLMMRAKTTIFLASCWLYRLFCSDMVPVISCLLQLHRVLQVAQLVVWDEQVASAGRVRPCLLEVAHTSSSSGQLSFLHAIKQ